MEQQRADPLLLIIRQVGCNVMHVARPLIAAEEADMIPDTALQSGVAISRNCALKGMLLY